MGALGFFSWLQSPRASLPQSLKEDSLKVSSENQKILILRIPSRPSGEGALDALQPWKVSSGFPYFSPPLLSRLGKKGERPSREDPPLPEFPSWNPLSTFFGRCETRIIASLGFLSSRPVLDDNTDLRVGRRDSSDLCVSDNEEAGADLEFFLMKLVPRFHATSDVMKAWVPEKKFRDRKSVV